MILLALVSLAASCAPVKFEPVAIPPVLPEPCDINDRGNGHRFAHCYEQHTTQEAKQ